MKYAKRGHCDDINAAILIQHYANIKRLRADELAKKSVERLESDSTPGLLAVRCARAGEKASLQGNSAKKRGLSCFVKPCNKWWDGYEDEDVVITEIVDRVPARFLSHLIKT